VKKIMMRMVEKGNVRLDVVDKEREDEMGVK
jgi:hypothetical protein